MQEIVQKYYGETQQIHLICKLTPVVGHQFT